MKTDRSKVPHGPRQGDRGRGRGHLGGVHPGAHQGGPSAIIFIMILLISSSRSSSSSSSSMSSQIMIIISIVVIVVIIIDLRSTPWCSPRRRNLQN